MGYGHYCHISHYLYFNKIRINIKSNLHFIGKQKHIHIDKLIKMCSCNIILFYEFQERIISQANFPLYFMSCPEKQAGLCECSIICQSLQVKLVLCHRCDSCFFLKRNVFYLIEKQSWRFWTQATDAPKVHFNNT